MPTGGGTAVAAHLHRDTSPVAVTACLVGRCAVRAATLIVNDA